MIIEVNTWPLCALRKPRSLVSHTVGIETLDFNMKSTLNYLEIGIKLQEKA